MPRYSSDIRWSPEDGGYVAICPELDGISAFGETAGQAAAELETAVSLVVDLLRDQGGELPEAAVRRPYSGQFRLRLPPSLHEALVVEADREGVSLNAWIVTRLSSEVGRSEAVREARRTWNEASKRFSQTD